MTKNIYCSTNIQIKTKNPSNRKRKFWLWGTWTRREINNTASVDYKIIDYSMWF